MRQLFCCVKDEEAEQSDDRNAEEAENRTDNLAAKFLRAGKSSFQPDTERKHAGCKEKKADPRNVASERKAHKRQIADKACQTQDETLP